ncbi:uncharacterized protein LOC135501625 [Lineus longissimus]|uniref:uncharacterized protein LOC135501625 n=1 Tax=Lineus longissimus TaxID=88925 RepID=UPI00315D73D5
MEVMDTDDSGSTKKSLCTEVKKNEKSVCATIDITPVSIICDREQAGIDVTRPTLGSSNTGTGMPAEERAHTDVRMTTAESSDMTVAESSNNKSDKIDAFICKDTAERLSTEKCDKDLGKIAELTMDTTMMESLGLRRVCSTDTVKTGLDLSQNAPEKVVPGFAEKPVTVCGENKVCDFTVSFLESTQRMMQFAEILYKCKLCTSLPSILTSKDNFLMHVKDFHLKGNSADDFDCDDCDLKFRTLEDLKLHFRVCHGSCEKNETYTSYNCAKNSTSSVSNINLFSLRDSKSSDFCDMDRSSSESETESDDLNIIGPSSNVSNCEIQSSKPKMFNFSGGRGTKTRKRKSVPNRLMDSTTGIEISRCDIGENLTVKNVKVEPCDSNDYHGNSTSVDPGSVFGESEVNRKRTMVHILSPGQQTHTIHWGRGPSYVNSDEKVETSEPVCKKIKILDKVVKIPNPNCAEENSTDSDKVECQSSSADADGPLQSTPLMQPIPAIHDMQKYSKYLSRKSFFNMAAHQKLKSSAIYNLISTHMQKDTVTGSHGNREDESQRESAQHNVQQNVQESVPKTAQQNVQKNTQEKVARSPNFHILSASDRLKSFIKHKSDDLLKRRTGTKTNPVEQNVKAYVQMEPEDFSSTSANFSSHRKNETSSLHKTCGSLPANCSAKCTVSSGPEGQHSDSVADKFQKCSHDSSTSGPKQEKSMTSSAASTATTSNQDLDLLKTNPLPLLNMPTGASYKCFQCDEYFTDFSAYCSHYKRMHDSDMPYGTPIPKMEQCIALVKAIQTLLVATHSGYVSRDSILKEAAKEIGSTQVESWGAACNRAVKEVFPYSQTHRKGKYKDTYYFGVKFVEASDTAEDTDEEKSVPPGDNLWGNRQPKSSAKESCVDWEKIHRVLPDLVAWRGDEDAKVPRADLIALLRYSLKELDTSSSNWGWQCNRAVRLFFPEVVIERRGKHKHTYYQGLCYKEPAAVEAKLADISSKWKDTSHDEVDDVYTGLHSNEEVDSKSENSDPTDSELVMDEDYAMKEAADSEAHKSLKLRVCRAVANTKGPLTTPRAVQKKLNNVSTVIVTAMLKELSAEGYGTIQQPLQPRGRNKVVFFKSYPGTMREVDLLSGTGISAVTYKENFRDLSDPPIRGMYHRHPQIGLMTDFINI